MPKKYSLKRRRDFQRLFKFGARRYSRFFSLIFVEAQELKFAFITDSKTIRKPVDRVYARRIMREIVRRYFLPNNITVPMFIAIRPLANLKSVVSEIGFNIVKEDLIALLNRVNNRNSVGISNESKTKNI